MTSFPTWYLFGTFPLPFSKEIKLCMISARQAGISLKTFIMITPVFSHTRWKPLTGSMTNFVHLNFFFFV